MVKLKSMKRRSLRPWWDRTARQASGGRHSSLSRGTSTWILSMAGLSNVVVVAVVIGALIAVAKWNYRFVVHIQIQPQDEAMSSAAIAVRPDALLRSVEKSVNELLVQRDESVAASSVVDCARLLEDKRLGRLKFDDPNHSVKDSTVNLFHVTRQEPTFWISLHHHTDDPLAQSIQLQKRQPHSEQEAMEEIWRKLMDKSTNDIPAGDLKAERTPQVVILDVNAGSGYYSLASLAAVSNQTYDVDIHALEANPLHNLRICESLDANEWNSKITLHSAGIGNLGEHSLRLSEDTYLTLPIITLDAWAMSNGLIKANNQQPTVKLLRIGGRANMLSVLQGAERLLLHKAVENIFCEVNARSALEAAHSVVAVSSLLDAGYRLVGYGDVHVGPNESVMWQHDAQLVGNLVDAAQHHAPDKALSAWFQYPFGTNLAQQQRSGVYVSDNVKVLGSDGKSNTLPTVQCASFVPDALSGKLGFDDPNLGMDKASMQQYVNHTSPSFWISLHNKMFDFPRWGIKTSGKYYKVNLEDIWRKILSNAARGGHVIDVGSNIGYFTLLSLAMGDFVVHAFEPNSVNFLRLCESLRLNGWTSRATDRKNPRLFMYDAGVSDRDEALPFHANEDNPGASQFLDPSTPDFQYKTYVRKQVVSLDTYAQKQGWLETTSGSTTAKSSPPTIPILKIDVEGMEHRVLSGAAKLLHTHTVQNVFLELSVKDAQESLNSNVALSTLVKAGYALAGIGNWAGPGQDVPWKADGASLISRVLDEAERQDSKQLHVWFKVNQ